MRKAIERSRRLRRLALLFQGYQVIRSSGLFDAQWYRQRCPGARRSLSPILHYLRRGAAAGCDPNPLFDSAWYLKTNPDVAAAGLNPFVHYLRFGAVDRRNPFPLFDTAWYLAQLPDALPGGATALGHYLQAGWLEGRNPHQLFDGARYLEEHPDVRESRMNPLVHYRLHGESEGRAVHPVRRRPVGAANRGGQGGREVVIVSGEPHTPGHVYRAEMLATALAQTGYDPLVVPMEALGHARVAVEKTRALVIWRAPYSEQVASVVSRARHVGVKVVFDVDDLMIDPKLATTEVIDGIRSQGFTENKVAAFYRSIQTTMLAADFCMCPTETLAREIRRFQKAVFVLPNGFDAEVYERSRRAAAERDRSTPDGLIRIGYAGGSRTHQRDFGRAVPALARVLREFPHSRLVLFRHEGPSGILPCIDLEEYPELRGLDSRVEWRRLVPPRQLPGEMARFDINIAPLEAGNVFCEAKSALKYFEAGLVGVPTVASPTAPFVEAMGSGAGGFLVDGPEAWYEALSTLISSAERRAALGRGALLDVLWRFGPERRAALVSEFFEQVTESENWPAARSFALRVRCGREPRRPLPELPEAEVVLERGGPARSKVAVVVPLYNYAEHVGEALDSVKTQTDPATELVVVDDRSTDDSLRVAGEWLEANAREFTRVVLLQNRKNSGLALTRNAGFAATDARLVLPLDPDNRLLPGFLGRCAAAIEESGASAAYATIQEFDHGSAKRSAEPWKQARLVGGNYIDAMALIRKAAWAAVGGYQRLKVMGWEDFDLWCRFAEDGHWAVWVPEILAEYRVHRKSMLMTHTEVGQNRQILADQMFELHPWLDRQSIAGKRGESPLPEGEPR